MLISLQFKTVKEVKQAQACGCDVRQNEDYALRWAAREGYLNVVTYLIEQGPCVQNKNNSLLFWTASRGYAEITKTVSRGF